LFWGGAKGRLPTESSAADHRQEALILVMLSLTPKPEIYEAIERYTTCYVETRAAHTRGVYPNFLQ
jgi:hypothetical protein